MAGCIRSSFLSNGVFISTPAMIVGVVEYEYTNKASVASNQSSK